MSEDKDICLYEKKDKLQTIHAQIKKAPTVDSKLLGVDILKLLGGWAHVAKELQFVEPVQKPSGNKVPAPWECLQVLDAGPEMQG